MTDETVTAEPANLPAVPVPSNVVARCDVPRDLDQQMRLASAFSQAGILPKHLQNNPGNVLAIMFAARALDMPLWQASQGLHLVDGKVTMSAEMMRALWLRAGHDFLVLEQTAQKAVVEATRKGGKPCVVEYTFEDAKAAGLTGKQNYSKHPKAMLVARATSTALRQVGADVLAGFYTPEELSDGAVFDPSYEVTVATEAPATIEQDLALIAAEIDAAKTPVELRDLWRQYVAVLDFDHDGLTIRNRILAAQESLEVVDAELVEDAETVGSPASSTAPPADELIDCTRCEGSGEFEGKKCWVCLGQKQVVA